MFVFPSVPVMKLSQSSHVCCRTKRFSFDAKTFMMEGRGRKRRLGRTFYAKVTQLKSVTNKLVSFCCQQTSFIDCCFMVVLGTEWQRQGTLTIEQNHARQTSSLDFLIHQLDSSQTRCSGGDHIDRPYTQTIYSFVKQKRKGGSAFEDIAKKKKPAARTWQLYLAFGRDAKSINRPIVISALKSYPTCDICQLSIAKPSDLYGQKVTSELIIDQSSVLSENLKCPATCSDCFCE